MRTKILSFMKPSKTSMVASNRIARFLSNTLDIPIVWDNNWNYKKPLDILFIVNGAFAFCKYLEVVGKAVEIAKNIIWIQNDYTIVPPSDKSKAESPFRKAFVTRRKHDLPPINYWTTIEKNSKITPLSRYINWNSLTFSPLSSKTIRRIRKDASNDLFYYGSFRTNRIKAFDRFFDYKCKISVSSPSKKFQERYQHLEIAPPIKENFYESLAGHGLGLYIEDKKSHEEFHSAANRFYEMLSAGLPMVFQKESQPMMKRGGFDVSDFVVESEKEVKRALKNKGDLSIEQRKRWADKDYVGLLKARVLHKFKHLRKSI